MEGKLQTLETKQKVHTFIYPTFLCVGRLDVMILLRGNVHFLVLWVSLPVKDLFVWWCTKIHILTFRTVYYWRPPDLCIFLYGPISSIAISCASIVTIIQAYSLTINVVLFVFAALSPQKRRRRRQSGVRRSLTWFTWAMMTLQNSWRSTALCWSCSMHPVSRSGQGSSVWSCQSICASGG